MCLFMPTTALPSRQPHLEAELDPELDIVAGEETEEVTMRTITVAAIALVLVASGINGSETMAARLPKRRGLRIR